MAARGGLVVAVTGHEPSGLLVLNPDVEMVSVYEFPPDVRERLGGSASDFILSDRTSRIGSKRIDQAAAMFLRRFREPRRIVEAVVEHSAEVRRDPAELLDAVYPLITSLRLEMILVDPRAERRRVLGPRLAPGDVLEGHVILECVSDLAETVTYKAAAADGSPVAIKHLRAGADAAVRDNLCHEAAVLRHLAGEHCRVAPRLRLVVLDREDPFLGLDWFEGRTLFESTRAGRPPLPRRASLVSAVLGAYRALHACGVLHGDVHPRNVLVLGDGSVRLVDFGGAVRMDADSSRPRIGLVHYYEPEVARAVLDGGEPPQPSGRGEQFNIAALAYSVIARSPHLTLSLETKTALEQIAGEPPRPFDAMGLSWPVVERVLARALAKDPAARFPTCAEFFDALSAALATDIPPQRPAPFRTTARSTTAVADRRGLLESCARRLVERHGLFADRTREGLPRPPTASLYAGAGGIAYALLRVACLRGDAEALAAADVWITHALARRAEPMAFTDGSVGATTETGPLALFHSVTGLHVVNAIVRHASGDRTEALEAVRAFIRSVADDGRDKDSPTSPLELFPLDATNGAASLLLGASLVAPLCGPEDAAIRSRLDAVAAGLRAIVLRQLRTPAPKVHRFLGFAHGRSGAVHSLLRWAEVSGAPPGEAVAAALDELATAGRPAGDGTAWPIERGDPRSPAWTGWCHGSAGHLLTWTTAARVLRRPKDLELALAAGRHIWESRGRSGPSLCCGAAGEAMSLFELARAAGDAVWIDRGLELATLAARSAQHTNDAQGLFRADVGVALAAAESIDPAASSWPLCGSPL
jgi:serine/threonine protein kinase